MKINQMGARMGVQCDCGRFIPFDGYYYAHKDLELSARCLCGRSITLQHGEIVELKSVPAVIPGSVGALTWFRGGFAKGTEAMVRGL